jgi:hypothetical protein
MSTNSDKSPLLRLWENVDIAAGWVGDGLHQQWQVVTETASRLLAGDDGGASKASKRQQPPLLAQAQVSLRE